MSKQQPTVWDHDAHLALLQAFMAEAPPQPAQWDAILERVAKKGYFYTASAAIQHLQKLRRKDEKITSSGGSGDGPSTPKTPGGRKKNGPGGSVKKEPGSGTKRKPVAFIDDDSEDSKPVPVKKIKEESGVKSEESVSPRFV
ncbi:hypothetical protein VTI28DRAFT_3361 [Corynascus sepedonium]